MGRAKKSIDPADYIRVDLLSVDASEPDNVWYYERTNKHKKNHLHEVLHGEKDVEFPCDSYVPCLCKKCETRDTLSIRFLTTVEVHIANYVSHPLQVPPFDTFLSMEEIARKPLTLHLQGS